MEIIATGATILITAMGLKMVLYGVTNIGSIIERRKTNGKDVNS